MESRERIRVIKTSRIIPLPPVDWGGGDLRDVVLLEITSPEGITGLGSAYTGQSQLEEALTLFQQDPAALHNADEQMTIPMSAIDIALWDIRGKEENLPVSELLGGRKHDRILAYATVDLPLTSAEPGDDFDKTLCAALDQGFKAVKLCIENFGHRDDSRSDKEWDLREASLLRFARSIAGKDVQLMLDVYSSDPEWSGDFDWALKTSKVLDEEDFLWFEEPLAPQDIEDFAQLTQRTNVAISGGEDFIVLSDFENLSNRRAVDILQPDCTRVGGLTQMQSIRTAARQNNLHLIPHGYNTAVGLAADLQFQATVSDEKYCMVEVWPHSSITDLLKHNPFALDNEGRITVPTGAGLGVELSGLH
jgi:D-galactarolactone cycloisomerase